MDGAAKTSPQSYLVKLVDAAFEMAVARNLPILEKAVAAYNTALGRALGWDKLEHFRLADLEFFDQLNLDLGGLEGVKSELAVGNVERGKSAYEAYLRRRGRDISLERQSDFFTFATAKSRLERACRLSTQTESCVSDVANQAVSETCDIGIAGSALSGVAS